MARDGLPVTLFFLVLAFIFAGLAFFVPHVVWTVLLILTAGQALFSAIFYRDPEREIPLDPAIIVSPADGRIVSIRHVDDPFVGENALRISIFLNLLNVHVNRVPCSGSVSNSQYRRGRFLTAFDPKSSEENERTIIDLQNSKFRLRLIQIAGLFSRRIVNNLRPGDSVIIGGRFGMIKFGSRVDVIIPDEIDLKVRLKQRVKAGETVIGNWQKREERL